MRGMKDSGVDWIGEIPEEWTIKRTKYIANSMNKGSGITKDDVIEDGDIQCIRYGEIYSKYDRDFRTTFSRTNESVVSSPNHIQKGDILFTCTGELIEEIGKNVVYMGDLPCLAGGDIIVLKHEENPIFLNYALNSSYAQSQKSLGKTKLKVVHISAGEIGNILVALPSSREQSLIANYLDRQCAYIDNIIEKTKASIEEYKLLRQTVVTQAVTKGVRGDRTLKDSGVEWIGEIPEDWDVYRIASLYSERKENGNDELPILTVSINTGVSDRELSDDESERVFVRSEDRSKYMRVYPGDLTYNMMRAWQGAFGAVRVDGMVSPAYVIVKSRREIDSRYMEALLRTQPAKEEMKRYSHGIADFRLRLYWDKFRTIKVCFPPIEEQREIADYIDQKCSEIDALIAKKEQFLTELENYKKSMIYEYVTGKKEVPHS